MVWVSNTGRDKRFISSPKRPRGFWGPLSLLLNCRPASFAGINLKTLVYLVPIIRIKWSYASNPSLSFCFSFPSLQLVTKTKTTLRVAGFRADISTRNLWTWNRSVIHKGHVWHTRIIIMHTTSDILWTLEFWGSNIDQTGCLRSFYRLPIVCPSKRRDSALICAAISYCLVP
jgi:hypothetical protein